MRHLLFTAFLSLSVFSSFSAQELELGGQFRHLTAVGVDDSTIPLNSETLDLLVKASNAQSKLLINPYFFLDENQAVTWGIREAYVDILTPLADLRIGKQALSWGQAEGFFITDLVSPQDLSSFILADFREIRKGVSSLKLSHYHGEITFEGVYIPWFEPMTLAPVGSMWRTPGMPDLSLASEPEKSLENGEVFARIGYFGSNVNGELVGAWAWDDLPTAAGSPLAPTFSYNRLGLAGGSLSTVLGPAVFRMETAAYLDKSFSALIPGMPPTLVPVKKNQYQALGGLDFSLLGWDLSAQYLVQWIQNHQTELVVPELTQTATFRVRETFLDETLKLGLFAYMGIDPWDALLRPSLTWAVEDGLEVELRGELFLGDPKGRFGIYDDKDLITLGLKYFF